MQAYRWCGSKVPRVLYLAAGWGFVVRFRLWGMGKEPPVTVISDLNGSI
jgi:hypothetical protein